MQFLDAARRIAGQREERQDVQHLERGHALAVGRQLVDLPAVVFGRNRLDPFGWNSARSSAVIVPPSARLVFRMASAIAPR